MICSTGRSVRSVNCALWRPLVERLPAALLAEHDPETGIRDPVTIALTPGSPLGEDRGGSLAFDEHDRPRNPERGR